MQEAALLSQIAHTGAPFDNVRAVRILVDGRAVESLGGHIERRELVGSRDCPLRPARPGYTPPLDERASPRADR